MPLLSGLLVPQCPGCWVESGRVSCAGLGVALNTPTHPLQCMYISINFLNFVENSGSICAMSRVRNRDFWNDLRIHY